jgi:hypothetical protein
MPLAWFFDIPPAEKWPEITGIKKYFLSLEYDNRRPDTYIYYKAFIVNLWLNVFFLAAYFISFQFHQDINLGFMQISYNPQAPVDTLVYGYPRHVFPILASVTIIYSTLFLCLKTDIYSQSNVMSDQLPIGTRVKPDAYNKNPLFFMTVILFLVVTGCLLPSFPIILREYELYNFFHDFRSHGLDNFVIFAGMYFVFYQIFYGQMFLMTLPFLTRNILKRYYYYKDKIGR